MGWHVKELFGLSLYVLTDLHSTRPTIRIHGPTMRLHFQPSTPTIGPHLKPKNNENEEWICLCLYRSATLFYGNLRFHPTLGTFENFDRERERREIPRSPKPNLEISNQSKTTILFQFTSFIIKTQNPP
jgi:hypothetical protein